MPPLVPRLMTLLCALTMLIACQRPASSSARADQATAPREPTPTLPTTPPTATLPTTPPTATLPTTPPTPDWRYHFTIEPDLVTLHAHLCFDRLLPSTLTPQARLTAHALRDPRRTREGEPDLPLSMRRGQLSLDLKPGDCVDYTLDVADILSLADEGRRASRTGDVVLLSPDYWLWRAQPQRDAEIFATIDAPDDVSVLVPWPRSGDGHRIPPTAFEWITFGAWGRLDVREIHEAGATLRFARIGGDGWTLPASAHDDWLRSGMLAVAHLFGDFPASDVMVIISPSWGSKPVFGSTMRGGGASIMFMVGADTTRDAMATDWLATHEMLHLGIPMLRKEDAWMDEGIPTYIEPILRARAGLISRQEAWEQLHDGFQRGAGSGTGLPLIEESAQMQKTRAYWRVYWAGGAIAFIADVSLRRASLNDKTTPYDSLDAQLRALRDCCLEAPITSTALQMLDNIPSPSTPGFAEIAARYLHTSTFPDTSAAFDTLGLTFDHNSRLIHRSDDPTATALRDAIMGGAPTAR